MSKEIFGMLESFPWRDYNGGWRMVVRYILGWTSGYLIIEN
jgi:hypothetical protein